MHIEHQFFGAGSDGFHHLRAKRDVRDKMPIHDIQMQPIGTGQLSAACFLSKLVKFGGKKRWRNNHSEKLLKQREVARRWLLLFKEKSADTYVRAFLCKRLSGCCRCRRTSQSRQLRRNRLGHFRERCRSLCTGRRLHVRFWRRRRKLAGPHNFLNL